MHFFALKVLPDPEPTKPEDGSGPNLTDATRVSDLSWPSCSLHVSNHSDGLAETDLENFPNLTQHTQVENVQRMQTWVEVAENMDNPNAQDPHAEDQTMLLDYGKGVNKEIEDGATSDLDDEAFLFYSSHSSSLEDRLLKSFVRSTFDSRTQDYLPEGQIAELVTVDTIRQELDLDNLDASTASRFGQSRQAELLEWIILSASKLFAICVECGIRPRRNILATFLRFKKYAFGDHSLPIPPPEDNRGPTATNSSDLIFHEQVWTRLNLYNFYDKQWKYLVPVFGTDQYDYDLASNCILPFSKSTKNNKAGAFSTVYEVKVHPNHMRLEHSMKVS